MPSLEFKPKIEKITLAGFPPEDPGVAELDLRPLTPGDMDMTGATTDADPRAMTMKMIALRLKSWNLTQEDPQTHQQVPAPITPETVAKLPLAVIAQLDKLLMGLVEPLANSEKKS